jgi:hypothetical protein
MQEEVGTVAAKAVATGAMASGLAAVAFGMWAWAFAAALVCAVAALHKEEAADPEPWLRVAFGIFSMAVLGTLIGAAVWGLIPKADLLPLPLLTGICAFFGKTIREVVPGWIRRKAGG